MGQTFQVYLALVLFCTIPIDDFAAAAALKFNCFKFLAVHETWAPNSQRRWELRKIGNKVTLFHC
jgi:hypothetical protein